MPRKLTADERHSIETQIEQITAFLDHCYDGMCHDVAISWALRDGWNPVKGEQHNSYAGADKYIERKGKHTRIDIGYGDAYYGSSSLGHMLHDVAYEWREKLLVRLADDKDILTEPTLVGLYST